MTVVSALHAAVPMFGRAARLMQTEDDTAIRKLAERDILALEADWDQVLPEAWIVCAYLAPDSDSQGIRRGRILDLRSRVEDRRATEWRVTSREGRYAQVAARGRPFTQSVGADDIDRPFRVFGDFSDQELARVIAYVRSSPRKPPIPDDPDGTSHAELDRLDGRVPVVQLKRVNRNTAEAWMGRRRGSGLHAVLHYRNGSWHVGEISFYVS